MPSNKFSRRHYIVIAATLALISDTAGRKQAAHLQADLFAADNPKRFDRRRFLTAAGAIDLPLSREQARSVLRVAAGAVSEPEVKAYLMARAETF